MSLNFDLKNIENYEEKCWIDDKINPRTETVIFATMWVGMGEITEDNADEFYARFKIAEKSGGPFMFMDGEDYEFTPEDIIDHIGLRTNAGYESRQQWIKRYFQSDFDDAFRIFGKAMKQHKELDNG